MLQEIFNSITPENIKNEKIIRDAMEVFISVIEEKCEVSKDIKNIFNEDNKTARDEFIKIYLDDMNRYFTKAKASQKITKKIDRINELYPGYGIDRNFIGELYKIFNDEHFVVGKSFKQKKGTQTGIEYVYNLVETLIEGGSTGTFELIEGDPFQFEVHGSLYKEIYEEIIRPIAHPLGFLYVYFQLVKLTLEDYFNIEYNYSNIEVEVRCYENLTDPYNGNDVTDIFVGIDGDQQVTRVTFSDGSYLLETYEPTAVSYYDSSDTIITDYAQYAEDNNTHCVLYLNYDVDVVLLTADEASFVMTSKLYDNFFEENDSFIIGGFTIGAGGIIGSSGYHTIEEQFCIFTTDEGSITCD